MLDIVNTNFSITINREPQYKEQQLEKKQVGCSHLPQMLTVWK